MPVVWVMRQSAQADFVMVAAVSTAPPYGQWKGTSPMTKRLLQSVMLLLLVALLAACAAREAGSLTYNGPTEQTVPMNEGIPGSNLRYVGYNPQQGATVLIDDQQAVKKVGDSLDWQREVVPGVRVSMAQRIVAADEQRLQTVGTVRVAVSDAQPEVAQFPDNPAFRYKVAFTYTVRKGERIPGTLITYKGNTENGAEFEGVSGYPYRKLGDSVSWSGRLRGNAYLDMTSRVTVYTDEFVTLVGLADIGLI
jgi:hypothetical protein